MPPLSPRAQEILDAIEREVVAGHPAAPPRAPQHVPIEPPARSPADAPDPARLLELVDVLRAQAEQARLRLATLTAGLRDVEERLSPAPSGRAPAAPPAAAVQAPEPALDEDLGRVGDARPQPVLPSGVLDLHFHLLPDLDDGPATLDEALALARATVAAGTTTVVATPHVSWDYPATTSATIARRLAELEVALDEAGIELTVLPGAEVALSRAVDLPDAELAALRLGGGPYLLVECPFTPGAAGIEALLGHLLDRGHLILLAHPERCPAFQQDSELLARLVGRGVLGQLTAGSLAGRFGAAVRTVAHGFLRDGLAHLVASDAHSVARRPPTLVADLKQEGFEDQTPWLVLGVPRAVLDGGPVPPAPVMPAPPRSGLKRLLGR